MHAIQRYHYDRLQKCLRELQTESIACQLSEDHLNTIVQQEKKLKQLYNSYTTSLREISILIKQYEQEHHSVRRLISSHKQHTKSLQKKSSKRDIIQE